MIYKQVVVIFKVEPTLSKLESASECIRLCFRITLDWIVAFTIKC
jgi:hypothetical protein